MILVIQHSEARRRVMRLGDVEPAISRVCCLVLKSTPSDLARIQAYADHAVSLYASAPGHLPERSPLKGSGAPQTQRSETSLTVLARSDTTQPRYILTHAGREGSNDGYIY